ncbi:MAG: hypothetical protein LH654_02200 [Thermoleophilia bacterium]|nr:hypothetical protein [Thermoleophilia bacterium]
MPTPYKRIPVTADPPLADALVLVAPLYPDLAPARLVHDLAIKGARAAIEERRQTGDAVEALIAFSTERQDLIDWDAFERVDDAWRDE